jgi:hypothetical protein
MPTKTTSNHGGTRAGAGRKPKALRYARELAAAEGQIIAALPDVISGLIRAAKGDPENDVAPDVSAAKYLLDRTFGRVAETAVPMADDRTMPYSQDDFDVDEEMHEAARMAMGREVFRMQAPIWAQVAKLDAEVKARREEAENAEADDDE